MTVAGTSRIQLHVIHVAEAERIVARRAGVDDAWADDFPFEGDVMAVTMFLRATAAQGDQQPFGVYRITRVADGKAIGGVGFKGRPENGCVEIGYGLVPSARGHGFATEAVVALLKVATTAGINRVIADTVRDNVASRRTLLNAGFRPVRADAELLHFEILLS